MLDIYAKFHENQTGRLAYFSRIYNKRYERTSQPTNQ